MNLTSSFDIFDTCLIRSCGSASAMFDILSLEAFTKPVSDDIRHGFILARINAESHNSLQLIYDNLNFSHEHLLPTEKLIENELLLEDMLLNPVKRTLDLINRCRKKGHRIIFISDMYLPSSFLCKQLEKHGFWRDGDTLFVSNEVNKTKSTGELFKYIAKKENLNIKKWHHYGDNLRSDVIVPHKLGIKTTSQDDISKDMNLIDMPLSVTIFDMEILWKPLFRPKLNEKTGKPMLENDENGFAQPLTNWNDVRKSFEARKKVNLEKNVRTDFANTAVNESVALNSTLQVIIKKLDDLSGGQFTNEYKNNNLSEVEKIIKMAIGRGNLDMTEREEIRKYIENSHNV